MRVFRDLWPEGQAHPTVATAEVAQQALQTLMQGIEEVATLDFSSERKAMSKIVKNYAGKADNCVLLKGAPERVVAKCSKIMTSNGQESALNDAQKKTIN